jgi:hypothetical protein
MASNITKSEQLKRKSQRNLKEKYDTDDGEDEDDEEDLCYLVTFEEKEGKKDFSVVKASDVGVLAVDPDKGVYKYRGKSYIVEILKRGKTFFECSKINKIR